MKNTQPPRWATRLLTWYCKPQLLEDLQGDLYEYFERNVQQKGVRYARLIYVLDVFKFFRSYTVSKPSLLHLLIHWLMLNSYFKTTGRSLLRNKLFSTINVIGLAISMSVGLLVISMIVDLKSYDIFHAKGDRIYRVVNHYSAANEEPRELASTSLSAGMRLKESVSGIEDITTIRNDFSGDIVNGEKTIPVQGLWADESFTNVFTFPLLEGNAATALKEPYSLVLTERTAKKLFGEGKGLGETLRMDTVNYVVTGIMQDVPEFSHVNFDALASLSTLLINRTNEKDFTAWQSMWSSYVYVVLPEGTDPESLKPALDRISAEANKQLENRSIAIYLQPLKKIVMGQNMSNTIGANMPTVILWILGGLAGVVLLSACFNYTNLSIARSMRRSREVGIRKVTGAFRSHVMVQFVVESVVIALLALVLSFLLFLFIRPHFLGLAPELQNIVSLKLSPVLIVCFVALAIITGVVAGIFPALFFSRINPVQVLKNIPTLKVFGSINLRKTLIVVQYTFSLVFIATTLIGYKQYKHFLSFDLGFSTANVININLQGNKSAQLMKELEEIPEIDKLSRSIMITGIGSYWSTQAKYPETNDSTNIYYNVVDENYFSLHGHSMIAGRDFKAGSEHEIIVNEQLVKRFRINDGDPQKAIGVTLNVDGKLYTIAGVARDFYYGEATSQIDPFVFRFSRDEANYVNAIVSSQDWPATMHKISAAWNKIDKVHPLDVKFYSEQLEKAYSGYSVMLTVIGFLAFLAVSIASMGLFGMVVFTTETRQREMGIRKALGANESGLIYLLSRGFLGLLLIAAAIALPLTYFFFDQVILTSLANHAALGIAELLWSAGGVLVLALLMIGSQTWRVARTSPAVVLKCE